jgi:signal transduction histidine kinase/phage shock protein PspC (stress-responsive transcriptional regulator)
MDHAARPSRALFSRSAGDRVLTGVAGGLGETLGVDSSVIRLALVVLSLAAGLGVVLYVLLYLVSAEPRPGVVSHVRRPTIRQAMAVGLIVLGVLLFCRELGLWFGDALLFPVVLLTIGSAVLWTRGDDTERERWRAAIARLPEGSQGVVAGRGHVVRLALGAFLLLAGMAAFFAVGGVLSNTPLAVVATLLGIGVIAGPWLWALFRQLSEERRERIRSEEREEVAAHLHDSVLQTLALIQRSEEPREMASLARSQERELRDWLYGGTGAADATLLSTAVNEAAAEIERTHRVRIDVVTVGDRRLDDEGRALVLAAREAMANAAVHAGVGRLSVYVESGADGVAAFVRDQGVGFDPASVPDDRHGIADSISGRMMRAGGNVEVVSSPGHGTEVRLGLPTGAGAP